MQTVHASTNATGHRERVRRLFAPVDASSLAFFRIAFGVIMVWEVVRYFSKGWIFEYYIQPDYNFPYAFFEWITPWPGNGMYLHFIVLGVAGACMALGLFYRVSAVINFLAFTYVFLLEEARYLNHFYLVSLISLVMVFVPAHRVWSVDALRARWATTSVPLWSLALVRFMIGVPYFFGGIAKLNGDWLRGEPLRSWLARCSDYPLVGPLFLEESTVYLFSYGGLLLDLLAPWLLLASRTRIPMMFFVIAFHFTNSWIFSIGIFPWFMIAGSLMFFPADWPRRMLGDIWVHANRRGSASILAGVVLGLIGLQFEGEPRIVPMAVSAVAGMLLMWTIWGRIADGDGRKFVPALTATSDRDSVGAPPPWCQQHAWVLGLLVVWVGAQVLLPLRHYIIPGHVSWTEEGHRFAWHMKLRDKDGQLRYRVHLPEIQEWRVIDPAGQLTRRQARKLSTRPYMIQQYAKKLAADFARDGHPGARVHADSHVSLNGRPPARMIDPKVDLAAEPTSYWHAHWILPLEDASKASVTPR